MDDPNNQQPNVYNAPVNSPNPQTAPSVPQSLPRPPITQQMPPDLEVPMQPLGQPPQPHQVLQQQAQQAPAQLVEPQVSLASNPPQNAAPNATPAESRQELHEAIRGSGEVLASATTVLTIFPDTLTLDRAKITITKRQFFSTAEVMSLRIEDVLNVTASVGPFLGSIKITSRVMNTDKPYTIGRFWREDALRIKRITQGYVIALQRKIDCSTLPVPELVDMLEKLGQDDR